MKKVVVEDLTKYFRNMFGKSNVEESLSKAYVDGKTLAAVFETVDEYANSTYDYYTPNKLNFETIKEIGFDILSLTEHSDFLIADGMYASTLGDPKVKEVTKFGDLYGIYYEKSNKKYLILISTNEKVAKTICNEYKKVNEELDLEYNVGTLAELKRNIRHAQFGEN